MWKWIALTTGVVVFGAIAVALWVLARGVSHDQACQHTRSALRLALDAPKESKNTFGLSSRDAALVLKARGEYLRQYRANSDLARAAYVEENGGQPGTDYAGCIFGTAAQCRELHAHPPTPPVGQTLQQHLAEARSWADDWWSGETRSIERTIIATDNCV